MTKKLTNFELLQELDYRLNQTKAIFFWIENQNCYLLEPTWHYCHKVKVGDLAQTKESYFKGFEAKLKKILQESKTKKQLLNTKLSQISDVELIEELEKRSKSQAIKLSMFAGNDSIHLEAHDIQHEASIPFPIEVQAKGSSVKGGSDD